MTIVYRKCHKLIGAFNDTQFIFQNLEKTNERAERDRLVQFIEALMNHERNAKLLLDCNGIKVLVELLTLAHLHTSRATVPLQSNLIEASPEMSSGASSEKEWYFTMSDNKKQGPIAFEEVKEMYSKGSFDSKTKFWAQGMEGWKTMRNISQLKWAILASDQAVMNESELCVTVLNILNKICSLYSSRNAAGAVIRPLPRIRRMLSEPVNLPHLVQVTHFLQQLVLLTIKIWIFSVCAPPILVGAYYFHHQIHVPYLLINDGVHNVPGRKTGLGGNKRKSLYKFKYA